MPITAVWNFQSSWPFGRVPCKIQAFVKTTFMTADGLIIIMIGKHAFTWTFVVLCAAGYQSKFLAPHSITLLALDRLYARFRPTRKFTRAAIW